MKNTQDQQLKLIKTRNIFSKAAHVNLKESPNKIRKPSSKRLVLENLAPSKAEDNDLFYLSILKKIKDSNNESEVQEAINKESPTKKKRHSIKNQCKTKKEKSIRNIRNIVVQSQHYNTNNAAVDASDVLSQISNLGSKERNHNAKSTKGKKPMDIKQMYQKMQMDNSKLHCREKMVTALSFKKAPEEDKIEQVVQLQFNSIIDKNKDVNDVSVAQPKSIHIEKNANAKANDDALHIKEGAENINDDVKENNEDIQVEPQMNIIASIDGFMQLNQCDQEEPNIIDNNNKNTITKTNTDINNNNNFIFNTNIHIHQISPIKKSQSSSQADNSKKSSKKNLAQIVDSFSSHKPNNDNSKQSSLHQIEDFNQGSFSIKKSKRFKCFFCLFCMPTSE